MSEEIRETHGAQKAAHARAESSAIDPAPTEAPTDQSAATVLAPAKEAEAWRLPPWLLPLLLAIATALYLLLRPAPPPEPVGIPSFPPATATAVALLGDLDTGSTVAGFRVDGIEGPGAEGRNDTAILVHLSQHELRLAITIVPRGAESHNPPAHTAHYDLFFGHLQPDDARLDAEPIGALLDAFTARVRAHE
ncbi:MAG TPA: hypothetical protein ENJ18_12410 [Nannocystis exedens]|nr:hypothetical protein [Nannocystis exedens]